MNRDAKINLSMPLMWIMLITAGITFAITLGGVYLLGYHPSHSITVSDPVSGEEKTLWTCGMHPWIIEDKPGNCPICGMKLTPIRKGDDTGRSKTGNQERKVAYWRAPMNPMEIYDKPGKSAMGMDLVPVYEDEVIGGVAVSIDPTTQENMGIRTAKVDKGTLTRTINTYGHVTYDETRTAEINPRFNGWIEKIYADFEGKQVKKNEPLFEIYSPDLIAAQEEYLSAVRRAKQAGGNQSLIESARMRLENFDVSENDIRRIETTGKIQKAITIRSPFNGIVTLKKALEGSHVTAGTTVYRISDITRVWVEVHIYEYELPWVEQGQAAIMKLPYDPGQTYTGKVSFIYPYLQPQTRDVVARLEFENPHNSIKPDMYADIQILTQSKGEGMIIPSEAVIRSGKRNVVFVTRENNKFSPREVTLGISLDGGNVQVLTGLAPGETVVTSGQFMLDSESKLKEAIQKMMDVKSREKAPNKSGNDAMEVNKKEADDFFKDME